MKTNTSQCRVYCLQLLSLSVLSLCLLSAAPAAGASRTFFGPFSASETFNCSGTFFPPNSGTARVVFTGNITITLFDSASGVAQLSDASRTFSGCYQEFQNWNFGHDLTNTGGDHWVHTSNFPVTATILIFRSLQTANRSPERFAMCSTGRTGAMARR